MSISVIVGTFGDDRWVDVASTAIASAKNQTLEPLEVIHVHADSLHEARNQGATSASGDWLIFLDADDELDHGFIESMTNFIKTLDSDLWLIQPATLGIVNGIEDDFPWVIPSKRSILDGNWMVIATGVSRSVFSAVGGFKDFDMYEDWDLWIRCINFGCKPTVCERAIYRINVRSDSRNNQSRESQISTFNKIRNQYI